MLMYRTRCFALQSFTLLSHPELLVLIVHFSQRQEGEAGEAKQPQPQQPSAPFVAVALDKNRPAWMARQDNVLLM